MNDQSVSQVIGLFGLPRSGSTLLTAMIGAHSKAACVYEPWHSKQLNFNQTCLSDLMPLVSAQDKRIDLVCLKETATKPDYLIHLDQLLNDACTENRVGLIWIIRRPMDTFLSQVAADHRWRKGTFNPDPANFKYWAGIIHDTFVKMSTLLTKYNSRIVFYENMTASPQAALKEVMSLGELAFEPEQLKFHESIDRKIIRGDRFVMDEAGPVKIQSAEKYKQQITSLVKQYSGNKDLSYILEVSETVSQYSHLGVITPPHPVVDTLIECARNNYPHA